MGENERDEARGDGSEDSELKVTDRRLFTSDGVLRHDLEEDDPARDKLAADSTTIPPTAESPSTQEAPGFERRSLDEPSGVDFTMLINAMAQPALIFLGEIAHPSSGRQEVDLEQARVQIDLLDILRIKCRGNLTSEEDALLDRVLYELRMRYVTRSSQPQV